MSDNTITFTSCDAKTGVVKGTYTTALPTQPGKLYSYRMEVTVTIPMIEQDPDITDGWIFTAGYNENGKTGVEVTDGPDKVWAIFTDANGHDQPSQTGSGTPPWPKIQNSHAQTENPSGGTTVTLSADTVVIKANSIIVENS